MNYEITLNYIENVDDLTLLDGTRVDIFPYYEGRIIRLGISATGSSYVDALNNTIIAASGSAFTDSY